MSQAAVIKKPGFEPGTRNWRQSKSLWETVSRFCQSYLQGETGFNEKVGYKMGIRQSHTFVVTESKQHIQDDLEVCI